MVMKLPLKAWLLQLHGIAVLNQQNASRTTLTPLHSPCNCASSSAQRISMCTITFEAYQALAASSSNLGLLPCTLLAMELKQRCVAHLAVNSVGEWSRSKEGSWRADLALDPPLWG